MTSTYDSAESIATLPPESDLDDEQMRKMLASPLFLHESKCRPITSSSLLQRKLSGKFISLPRQCRETCRSVLTQQKVESRNTFRQRKAFPQDINQFKEKDETLFRFSDPEEAAR